MPGTLVISLDFELIWGIFDHCRIEDKIQYFENTRRVIPRILDLFAQHEIQATWATVGMLFCHDWDDWRANWPEQRPNYTNKALDPYAYGLAHQKPEWSHCFFAPELIQQIIDTPGQELGTHTFSHYYCQEPGHSLETFAADLATASTLAHRQNCKLESLVFPRNQFNTTYVNVCDAANITSVRTNPDCWFWQVKNNSLRSRCFRTGDAYLPLGNRFYARRELRRSANVWFQPASRFLRPHSKNQLLNRLRLGRITSEMTAAVRNDAVYHLWWHPHNFGTNPEDSLAELKLIIKHARDLHQEFGLEFHSMGSLGLACISGIA